MRFKILIQYKGTRYHGWQVQPGKPTVQEILQKTLSKILNSKITIVASGRTDAGVHALAQVAHFDAEATPQKLLYGLTSLLPDDISVLSMEPVPETFHAQLSAKRKIYEYRIWNSQIRNPFLQEYSWRVPYPLDLAKMKKAAKLLIGEHDFKSFCAADSSAKTTVRRVYWCAIRSHSPAQELCHSRGSRRESIPKNRMDSPPTAAGNDRGGASGNDVLISITGSGFLKQMVRNIVGTLVDVGRGKMTLKEFQKAFKSCDRRKTGRAAPAKGLFLKEVIY